jgi:rubredoxin
MIDTLLYATTGIAVVGALAAWVCNRHQAARLRDLQERIDRFDDALAEMGQTATAFDCGHPSTTPMVLKRPVTPDSERVVGKSPDLAAPFTGEARHPLYAKTGLPNQPVASLRPGTPAPLRPNWNCPNCSYRSYQPRVGKPRCPICKGLEIIE